MRPPEKPETEAEAQEGAVDSERKIPPEAAPPQNVSASRMSESVIHPLLGSSLNSAAVTRAVRCGSGPEYTLSHAAIGFEGGPYPGVLSTTLPLTRLRYPLGFHVR